MSMIERLSTTLASPALLESERFFSEIKATSVTYEMLPAVLATARSDRRLQWEAQMNYLVQRATP